MIRDFYSSALFFTSLYFISSLWHSIMYFQLGSGMARLSSLPQWFALFYAITFLWSLVMMRYYYHKRYRLSFWVLGTSLATLLFYFVPLSEILFTHEISKALIVATLAVLITGAFHGATLIFSRAGERPWLKAAGVCTLVLDIAILCSIAWGRLSATPVVDGTIATVERWSALMASIVPALFFMNFRGEHATAKSEDTSRQDNLIPVMDLGAFITIVCMVIIMPKVVAESLKVASGRDHVIEGAKRSAKAFEARTYVSHSGEKLPYRILKPLDYDSTKSYPIVVCLHGSSGRGTDNILQIQSCLPAQLLSKADNRSKYPAFLLVPQCPLRSVWGGIEDVHMVDALVCETILALEKEFPIDTTRRYIAGNSLGGYGTWHLISTRPEMFAAAIPISGAGDPEYAAKIANIPVWAFHGAKDLNVPVTGSRNIINAMKKAGGQPRYSEYAEEAHDISRQVMSTPGLLDWLFAQKRE